MGIKTLKDIRSLLDENMQDYDVVGVEPTPEDKMLHLALDLMHELVARKEVEGGADIEQIAQEVAMKYAGVDMGELLDSYYQEVDLEHDDVEDYDRPDVGMNPTAQAVDMEANEEYIKEDYGYKEAAEMALTQMHFIKYAAEEIIECIKTCDYMIPEWYQNKVSKVEGEMEGLHSYMEGKKRKVMDQRKDAMISMGYISPGAQYRRMAESYNQTKEQQYQIDEVLDPKDDAEVWIKDFIDSDNPKFKGKSKEKRKEMALAAWYAARREAGIEESKDQSDLKWSMKFFNDKKMKEDDIEQKFIEKYGEKEGTRRFVKAYNEFLGEAKLEKDADDPCWKGYVQLGTKMKDGKEVPNCVPMEEAKKMMSEEMTDDEFDRQMVKLMNSGIGEDLIKAIEDEDKKKIEKLIKGEVKNASKVKELVDRIMKG